MHKRKLNRNTLKQGIKAAESLSRFGDQEDRNDSSDHLQLPSLQTKKKTWKDVDENTSTWDRNSTAMDIFCSTEIETIATRKVVQQWELVENTLYEDGEEVTRAAVLEECVQWRTQIPHLRVIGKNPFIPLKINHRDLSINSNRLGNIVDSRNDDALSEYSGSLKERKHLSKHRLEKNPEDEIFDTLYEYVISELFPNKENEIDSFRDDFNDALKICTAPIHSSKSSANSTRLNWSEEVIPLENKFSNNGNKAVEDRTLPAEQIFSQGIHKKYDYSIRSNGRMRNEKDESTVEDEVFRPHTSGRNKLGTVFKEKIVVSSVPYVLSTKESFSTIKTTPIQFMAQSYSLEVSAFQGMSRTVRCLKNSGKQSSSAKMSSYQSAWHAPVSPAVWPKNIKLAPLDNSRLPSGKNRSLISSSMTLPRNLRKPLSPISRPTVPVSAQINQNGNNTEGLEIQGRHITLGQSPKSSAPAIDKRKRRVNRK
ncbi:uncharacterized protein LOC143431155 [Xylocopa sonorina]|uniref:uncharacterized protein LOC143431155 n=1 Tax=Xylocopa sonorina TaxID=1818115 RepID=UPI00403B29B1